MFGRSVSADGAGAGDGALGFTIPERHVRGRLARLDKTLDAILSAHDYPEAIARLLAEALVLTALLGSTLKDAVGQLTLQAQTKEGVVDLLVADYRGGEMRGYIRHDPTKLADAPADPSLLALFGAGYLAITFDQAITGERYQGIVPLEGDSLAEAVQSYFAQSEQIASLVRVGVERGLNGGGWKAGGLLLQHLAEGEEGRERIHVRLDHPEWEHVRALAETVSKAELLDRELPLDALVWRLFHDDGEVRVLPEIVLSKGCRCDPEHIRDVVGRFPPDERAAMADENGVISVDCAFCSKVFTLDLAETES